MMQCNAMQKSSIVYKVRLRPKSTGTFIVCSKTCRGAFSFNHTLTCAHMKTKSFLPIAAPIPSSTLLSQSQGVAGSRERTIPQIKLLSVELETTTLSDRFSMPASLPKMFKLARTHDAHGTHTELADSLVLKCNLTLKLCKIVSVRQFDTILSWW